MGIKWMWFRVRTLPPRQIIVSIYTNDLLIVRLTGFRVFKDIKANHLFLIKTSTIRITNLILQKC